MLNSSLKWTLNSNWGNYPLNKPIFVLVEEDVESPQDYPEIYKIVVEEHEDTSGRTKRSIEFGKKHKYRVLDCEACEVYYLYSNNCAIIAWREIGE